MNLRYNKFQFFSPDEAGGGTVDTGEETLELLNTEDESEVLDLPAPVKEGEEGEEGEEEEEVDELKEIEDELKVPDEEDLLELTTPVRRREILAKYPKLFKDFPYLEKAYFREQQFTELLPTIQDARVAVDKARVLDTVEREVLSGDISSVLAAAKSESQEAFNKLADNYLPNLMKVDQQAYFHVVGNVIKDTIITMVREGRNLGEQGAPLQAAANVLNQFIFGSQKFAPPTTLSRPVNPEEQNREQQIQNQARQQFYQQFESVRGDLQTKADNVLKSTIDGHIDPRGTMTDYVKNHATQEAFENLEGLIGKDARFRSLLDKLWEKAYETNFSKESTDRIKSAYLSKAKTLLPSVIKKARNDALRGLGSRRRDDTEELEERPAKKGPITPGRSTAPSNSGGRIRKPSDIPNGMSTLDVLMKD